MLDDLVDILKRQPMFAALDDDDLATFARTGLPVHTEMGKTVFNENDPGDAAYVVYSGRVRIIKEDEKGKTITLGTLGRGELFGERAILTDEHRMAGARAAEDSVLVRFDRKDFESFYEHHAELKPYFSRLAKDRALINFLRLNTVFGAMPPKLILKFFDALEEADFSKGETVYRRGDPSDYIYVVRTGSLAILEEKDGEEKPVAVRTEGDCVGERSLILGEPRRASVTAVEDTLCLRIARDVFEKLLDTAPRFRETLVERVRQYDDAESLGERYQPKPKSAPGSAHSSVSVQEDTPPPEEEDVIVEPVIRARKGLFGKYPWLRQYDESDCGAACLAMISRMYGKRLAMTRLRDLANVGREGANMFSLASAAEAIGYSTRAVRTEYSELQKLDMPAIAHWAGYHFIVLYEVDEKKVVVGDPAIGLITIPREEFIQKWTGRLLLLTPTDELLQQTEQKTSLKRFLPLVRPFFPLLAEIFAASLVLSLLGLASPVFTQMIVDKVLVHQDESMLNIMLVGMIIVGLFSTLTLFVRQYLLVHVSQKLSLRMESDLYRQMMRLPMGYFDKRKVGDILTRFADNVKVRNLITGQAMQTALDLIMVVIYLLVMLTYSPNLTAVALMFVPLSILLTLIITPMMKRNNQQLFEKTAASQSKLIESINFIPSIKSAAAELPTRWKYEDMIVQEAMQSFQGARLGMLMTSLSSVISLASTTVILWYGAHLVIEGDMSVGQLMAFNALIGMVLGPIQALISMWQNLQDALLSVQRLSDIYDADTEEKNQDSLVRLPRIQGHISFENVSFRYTPDGRNVLANIHVEMQPGQTVAVVGRSGSGKTTLVSMLQRFHHPSEGRITIDGFDIAHVDLRSLRGQIGAVLQDSSIFSGTIRDNITIGEPTAPMDRIITAAKLANAHDFISTFPLGYQTVIGEQGVNLSGGQKQRLCIARALLSDPRVIIFDEATSALDTESERAIQQNMGAILRDRTAIIIAHRLSTIQNADRILVLDDGMLVETGSHAELMARKGLYYYLNSQQLSL